jgi:hypothetical protein
MKPGDTNPFVHSHRDDAIKAWRMASDKEEMEKTEVPK